MEVKINREIREYTESVFFGLSLRQFIFSALACGIAVGVYLLLQPVLGTETASWVCILAAFPFALVGACFRSEILMPKKLVFRNTNLYYAMLKDELAKHEKEEMKG